MQEEILREMRVQTAILRAAFREQLEALEKEVDSDHVSAAIFAHLRENGQTRSGQLKEAVSKLVRQGTDVSERTVKRRLAELEDKGVIERIRQGANVEYTLTGLIG